MSVSVTRLPSGLTVATHRMEQLESAALGVWVRAGSRSERADEHGISHLLEHMAFKGTARRSAVEIAEEVEAVGGDLNAATSVEATSYYARVLKNDVPLALDILSDILCNSAFDPDELQREKHVIVQEIGAAHDTPEDRAYDMLVEGAFPGQPLGRTILGTKETVTAFSPAAISGYLDRHYRGPSMVVSAAGAVDHDEVVRMAAEGFTKLAGETGPKLAPATYLGGDEREERDLQEAQIMLGFEGRAHASPDFHTAQVLAAVLGGGMSSRLFQEVREKRGLCYSIYSFHWSFNDSGLFGIHAATGEGDVAALVPVILTELEKVTDTLAQREIDKAKAQMRAGLLMALESPAARAGQMARQILIFGRPVPLEELVEKIEAVTVAKVKDLAASLFTGSPPTVVGVGPITGLMERGEVARRLGAPLAA
jgi:predicted Zn-dependent peptidase